MSLIYESPCRKVGAFSLISVLQLLVWSFTKTASGFLLYFHIDYLCAALNASKSSEVRMWGHFFFLCYRSLLIGDIS